MGNPFGPLFLESYPHDGQLRLSWSARSTLSSKKLSFWLLASSSWLNLPIRLEASGWWQGAGDRIQAPAMCKTGPVAQVARAHP